MQIVRSGAVYHNPVFGNNMMKIVFYTTAIITMTTIYSCQKPLDIKATDSNANVLVVEGFINTADSTKVNLSRTVVIGNKTTANPEGGANITIENATGTVATLTEKGKGYYVTPSQVLDNTKQYRIRIKTSNGKTYLSDLTDAKVTPPIDSIGYNITPDGLIVYANTHDATNKSRYYLYDYEETWEFRTKFASRYKTNGMAIVPLLNSEYTDHCFGYQPSTNVVLTSTTALTQDVVYQTPITDIIRSSEKISIKYSILLTQIALTKDAYAFWDNLRKNTEKLGSIFDAQPSQIAGNINYIADASEPVMGYISAGTKQTKRIFINKRDLPSNFLTQYPYDCVSDTALFVSKEGDQVKKKLIPLGSGSYVLDAIVNGAIAGYTYTFSQPCVDCTIRGRKQQPNFWK